MSALPRSRAAVALEAAPGDVPSKAARLDTTPGVVYAWLRGDRLPVRKTRREIADAYGIPEPWWEEPAPAREPLAPRVPSSTPEPATPEAIVDEADALLADIRDARRVAATMSDPEERIRTLKVASGMLADLAKLRGVPQTERAFKESPHFLRLADALTTALEAWPDAMRAAARALRLQDANADSDPAPEPT